MDRRLPFAYGFENRHEQEALALLKDAALRIAERDEVVEPSVFKTPISPAGRAVPETAVCVDVRGAE
jgi:hypothetical protein